LRSSRFSSWYFITLYVRSSSCFALFGQIIDSIQCNLQGEASKIQNQHFYRSTLEAMKAKEQAKHAKAQEKIQKPVHAPGQNGAVVAGDNVPVAEVQKVAIPPATGNEDTEEIPIAGRTKMTVPKKVNQPSEVQPAAKSEEEKEREEKEQKEAEATTELNAIFKRSPGMVPITPYPVSVSKTNSIQLSSSPNPTALTARKLSQSYWSTTSFSLRRSWSNWTSTRLGRICRPCLRRVRDGALFPMFWSTGRASVAETTLRHWIRATSWLRRCDRWVGNGSRMSRARR
jgi:hypothetical protein